MKKILPLILTSALIFTGCKTLNQNIYEKIYDYRGEEAKNKREETSEKRIKISVHE